MYKRIIWYSIIVISIISAIFLTKGFFEAVQFAVSPVKAVNEVQKDSGTTDIRRNSMNNSNTVHVLLMGDSIARGTGDEKLKGIGENLTQLFKNQTSKDIVVDNAGIDGYRSADLLELVNSGKLNNVIRGSDYIVISIGGNDLREIQTLQDMTKEAAFKDKLSNYMSSLKDIIENTRNISKTAEVVFVGLYNPYGDQGSVENVRLINSWNHETQTLVEQGENAVFISTYEYFKYNLNRFISPDKLHPNSMGYQTIAGLISKAVENTLNN